MSFGGIGSSRLTPQFGQRSNLDGRAIRAEHLGHLSPRIINRIAPAKRQAPSHASGGGMCSMDFWRPTPTVVATIIHPMIAIAEGQRSRHLRYSRIVILLAQILPGHTSIEDTCIGERSRAASGPPRDRHHSKGWTPREPSLVNGGVGRDRRCSRSDGQPANCGHSNSRAPFPESRQ